MDGCGEPEKVYDDRSWRDEDWRISKMAILITKTH